MSGRSRFEIREKSAQTDASYAAKTLKHQQDTGMHNLGGRQGQPTFARTKRAEAKDKERDSYARN